MLETNFSSPSKAGVSVAIESAFSVNLLRTYRANSRPLRHLGVSKVVPDNLLLTVFCAVFVGCHLSHHFMIYKKLPHRSCVIIAIIAMGKNFHLS